MATAGRSREEGQLDEIRRKETLDVDGGEDLPVPIGQHERTTFSQLRSAGESANHMSAERLDALTDGRHMRNLFLKQRDIEGLGRMRLADMQIP
jgi:hypothetical protein